MVAGRVQGDWELALAFSVVPVIGVVYALALLRHGPRNGRVRRCPELETRWSRGRPPCSALTPLYVKTLLQAAWMIS